MKIKRLIAVTVCFAVILTAFSFSISANAGSISFSATLNGEEYRYSQVLMKNGETVSMAIKDVKLDGVLVDESQISYQWSRHDPVSNGYRDIPGATSSAFSEVYTGHKGYMCYVQVGSSGSISRPFYLKEDTLTLTPSSNKPLVLSEEIEDWYVVSSGKVGSEVTVSVNATSTSPDASITYTWEKCPYYEYPDNQSPSTELGIDTNTLSVITPAGGSHYCCTVSDGKTTKYIDFEIVPDATITVKNTVNGETPSVYAGTYIYVVKPNEKLTVDVTSTSSFGDVKYTWFKQNEDGMTFTKLELTEGVLEVVKTQPTESDPYATQPYECYIEDGNQKFRYQILFFCLDPETPFAEIDKVGEDTPDVNFSTDNEGLANTLLTGEELKNMTKGKPAKVELSAELVDTASNSNSQNAINLEMNLKKNIAGDDIPITELDNSIELSVAIPDSLINNNTSVTREYQVKRMHNGESEVLNCTFDSENNTLSFETDKFSLYTISYTDKTTPSTPQTPSEQGTQGTQETQETQKVPEKQEAQKIPTSPQTGDSSDFRLLVALFLGSSVLAGVYGKKIKTNR